MIAFIICYWSAMSNQFKLEALMLLLIFSPKPDINLSICQLFNIFQKIITWYITWLTLYLYFKMLRTVGYLCVKFPFRSILFAEVITNKSFSTGKTIGPRPKSTSVSLMNNIIFFIQEYTSTSCLIITCVLSLLFSPFPVLKASSLEFVHPWRV